MKNTYQISRVKVALPPLGKVTHDDQGNAIRLAEEYRVHLYAVKPGWEQRGTIDGFMVGCAVGAGNSSGEYNITRDVIVPDGHKIIALRIGDNNLPVSWESLPVEFAGGVLSFIGSDFKTMVAFSFGASESVMGGDYAPETLMPAKKADGQVSAPYSLRVKNDLGGKQYAASMAVAVESAATKTRLSDDMRDAVIDAIRESKLFAELMPQSKVEFQADHFAVTSGEVTIADAIIGNALSLVGAVKQPQSGNVITVNINTRHNDEELSAAIAKAIQASLRPGGLIHNSVQKR